MIKELPYLFLIIILVVLPSIILWIANWKYFKEHLQIFVFVTICSIVWGFLFDIVGTQQGIWFYNHTLGISYLGLPLEEYLLLLLLPQQLTGVLLLVRRKIYG